MGHTIDAASYADGTSITWSGGTWPTGSGVADDEDYVVNSSTNRNNWNKAHYDDLGRVFRTDSYPGTESTNHVEVNNYYDRNGRLVCTGDKYGTHSEYAYDGAGRQYQTRTVKDAPAATAYTGGVFDYVAPAPNPALSSMSGSNDGLIEFSHTVYDDSGNATEQHSFESNHDDTNGIDIASTTSYVRNTIFSWYDEADRLQYVDNYGAGDGTTSTTAWKYSSIPTRAAAMTNRWSNDRYTLGHVLGTDYTYNAKSGRQETVTVGVKEDLGPADDTIRQVTKTFYDDLGRRVAVAENWDDFATPTTNIGDTSDGSKDRVTAWEYNGLGQTSKLTAYNGSSSAKQETVYLFEDEVNASLVTLTKYPDGSTTGTDNVQREYNLDGSLKTMTDQRTVKHTYSYNNRRQLTLDAVTATGGLANLTPAVDASVESIGRTYDDLGRLTHVTSYDTSSGTNELNEIEYDYDTAGTGSNDIGRVRIAYQDHAGAVGGTEPSVQYGYDADATTNVFSDALRLEKTTYPSSRIAHRTYGAADSLADRLSRVDLLEADSNGAPGTDLVQYSYNGTSRVVKVDNLNPDVHRLMFNSTSTNDYDAWDRFGRTVRQQWDKYNTSPGVRDQVDYTYDYAGNRLTRDVNGTTTHDQEYTYDGLQRLRSQKTGQLSSGLVINPTEAEGFTYDQLGNWVTYGKDTDGDLIYTGANDRLQTRSHDAANQLSTIDEFTNTDWVTAAHDLAGNMTEAPSPSDPTVKHKYVYDAWNRLVKVTDVIDVSIQENEFDGLNRRIVKIDKAANPAVTYDYYYNQQWQVLEIRKGGVANPWKQYVYHPDYVDSIALRYYDADTNGTAVEHYYLQDANFNVTAVTDNTGTVVERYAYTPYGEVTVLDINFAAVTGNVSAIGNELLYTGRRLDPETGLQLNRNRFYASHLGRWVNRDLVDYVDSWNLYAYVGAMPTYHADPSGEFAVSVPLAGFAAWEAAAWAGAAAGAAFTAWYYQDEINEACVTLQDALGAFRDNERFRRWWHRTWGDEKIGNEETENPDLPEEDILEGYEEWLDSGKPDPPGK